MTVDRELLQRAARAAGYKIIKEVDGLEAIIRPPAPVLMPAVWFVVEDENGEVKSPWDPLDYDGDALRLAVKLGLSIEVHHDASQPLPWLRVVDRNSRWTHAMVDEYAADPAAATRRAIVRAAAEMAP